MLTSINPATEGIVGQYVEHSPAELEQRMSAVHAAFLKWRSEPNRDRLMRNLAVVLRQRKGVMAALMTAEMGKPIASAETEIEKCAAACDYFADHAAEFLKTQTVRSSAKRSFVRFDPLGPVLAIMPWNFPLWQFIRFAAPALMAGNTAVLKHAPNVPGFSMAIEQAFSDAGFPPGVMVNVLVSENALAEKLIAHPLIAAVTLTGSTRAGKAVAATAGRSLKKCVLELGGSDPFIVLPDADIPATAEKAAAARLINSGQSCIAAKRFIVDQTIYDDFLAAFTTAMKRRKVGNGADRANDVGPLAGRDLMDQLADQVNRTIFQGGKLVSGGKRLGETGFFYEPTILTEVTPGMAAFDEETFGPAAAVIKANSFDHAIQLANQSAFGLGASVWTGDMDLAELAASKIEAGNVFINAIVASDPAVPFGGVKQSGWGRELAEAGTREFTNFKTVWIGG